jgi:hypothetical protein
VLTIEDSRSLIQEETPKVKPREEEEEEEEEMTTIDSEPRRVNLEAMDKVFQ